MATIRGSAIFSPCRTWRYVLRRAWCPEGRDTKPVMWVLLNPSTADETIDDPTMRRCIRFSQAFGGTSMTVTNIFAFRATDPRDMKAAVDPVGPENNEWIRKCADESKLIIAAWGVHGGYVGRSKFVLGDLLLGCEGKTYCLGVTKDGQPRHPLYLSADTKPRFLREGL